MSGEGKYNRQEAVKALDSVAVFDNTVFPDDDRVWCTIPHPKDELIVRVFIPYDIDDWFEVQLYNHIESEVIESTQHTVLEVQDSSTDIEYYFESKVGDLLREWRKIVL